MIRCHTGKKLPQTPSLIVFGEDDEQDNVPVWQSVYSIRNALKGKSSRNFTIRVFENSGHGLYEGRSQTIRQDFIDFVAEWIQKQF